MNYPTLEQVEKADRISICRWYRFLESPADENEIKVIRRLRERFEEVGGFNCEISKLVGWEEYKV